jgi:hypothetical protein
VNNASGGAWFEFRIRARFTRRKINSSPRVSSANGEEFVDQMRDYQRLKDDATPLNQFRTNLQSIVRTVCSLWPTRSSALHSSNNLGLLCNKYPSRPVLFFTSTHHPYSLSLAVPCMSNPASTVMFLSYSAK